MAEKVSVAKARARISALAAEVAGGGKRFIIERRGKPLAALVSMEDLDRLEQTQRKTEPHWALALAGAWSEIEDGELDSLIAEIYTSRERDVGRPVELDD